MIKNKNRRFYLISIAVITILSAYPLINGIRMAAISAAKGAIEPEQYAKYVVPYTAICVSILLFAVLLPIFLKLKRFAFPAGMISAYGVFFVVERFFETIQIHVAGMTLIDTSTLTPDNAGSAATADIWQAALCIVSPDMRGQSLTYASQDSFLYVLGDQTYKAHYYLISLIMITMVCGLLYGIAKMLRDNDRLQMKPVFLRGASTAALVAMCVFANTTAFFRRADPIQTPLASALTGLFFVMLGAAAGIYAGSYLLKKDKRFGIGAPVLLSLCVTVLMYIGEAVMMKGKLYRFGTGWFFGGLPGIVLAPVDILIVLLSGAAAWMILAAARKHENWPGKRTLIAVVALCTAVAASGLVIAATAPESMDDDIFGCYAFDENLYIIPFSSFMIFGQMPYVYGLNESAFIIANTETGDMQSCTVEYCKTPVSADEFSSKTNFMSEWLPDLSCYKERYLLAVMRGESGLEYGLYQMDGEIWLVKLQGAEIWYIYRLVKTETTTLADLERALGLFEGSQPSAPSLADVDNQMTLEDVYTLARKGKALTLQDFEPFFYRLTGPGFKVRRYDVAGADTVFVRVKDGKLESARLMSRRTTDPSHMIDLREGFEAIAQYMNPMDSFMDITIEDTYDGEAVMEYNQDENAH